MLDDHEEDLSARAARLSFGHVRNGVIFLVAGALKLALPDHWMVEQLLQAAIDDPRNAEWPSIGPYFETCIRLAAEVARAYPSIEESPLGPAWKHSLPGRTTEIIIRELDPEIRRAFGDGIQVLRAADQAEFRRMSIPGQAARSTLGRDHPVTKYLQSCGSHAYTVSISRDKWS